MRSLFRSNKSSAIAFLLMWFVIPLALILIYEKLRAR